jgi:hypothetical protein
MAAPVPEIMDNSGTFITNVKIGNKKSDNGTDILVKKHILPSKYSLIQQTR